MDDDRVPTRPGLRLTAKTLVGRAGRGEARTIGTDVV
jgi:hypothetical protein